MLCNFYEKSGIFSIFIFFSVLCKGVLKNFAKLTGKHLYQSLFLITLQIYSLELYLKRDSEIVVFLSILQKLSERFVNKPTPSDWFINFVNLTFSFRLGKPCDCQKERNK